MVVPEVSIFPLGTGSTRVSDYVAVAVKELGIGRTYTVLKMDERRDVESRSVEDIVRSAREGSEAR